MDKLKEKLTKALIEDSTTKYNGYAYGENCEFKSAEEVQDALKQVNQTIFDKVDAEKSELIMDF